MHGHLSRIYKDFRGKLVGNSKMKRFVCQTVAKLSKPLQKYICANCWFMGSFDDGWAFTFTGDDLLGQHLIFVSDDLLAQPDQQIMFTLAHEIGHVILKHRNSIQVKQSRSEIKSQELSADAFARSIVGK